MAGSDEAVEKSRAFTSGAGFDMSALAFGGEGTESLEIIKSVMKVSPDGHNMGRICLVGGLRTSMVWGGRDGQPGPFKLREDGFRIS